MMTRRRLTAEEIDLWHQVVEKTERLSASGQSDRPLPRPKPTKPALPVTTGSFDRALPKSKPPVAKPVKPPLPNAVQMDRKAFGRMKRGKLAPESRTDLHGMTLERAHPVLTRFILSSQASGQRLVLVITGKGRTVSGRDPFSSQAGVLRRNVPIWLSMPPLAQAVLQVTPAHSTHGGDGALYVYLRRSR